MGEVPGEGKLVPPPAWGSGGVLQAPPVGSGAEIWPLKGFLYYRSTMLRPSLGAMAPVNLPVDG